MRLDDLSCEFFFESLEARKASFSFVETKVTLEEALSVLKYAFRFNPAFQSFR